MQSATDVHDNTFNKLNVTSALVILIVTIPQVDHILVYIYAILHEYDLYDT